MALWFNSETGMLMTERDIVDYYTEFIKEMVEQNGIEYVLKNPEDFTLATWIDDNKAWDGSLHPVLNAEKFKTV